MACHIDGYDFVAPGDVPRIQKDGELKLLECPAYDLGYLTINPAKPPMDKLLVREAVAHGLDRQKLADSFQPPGSATVALQFQPPHVFGFAADAPQYAPSAGRVEASAPARRPEAARGRPRAVLARPARRRRARAGGARVPVPPGEQARARGPPGRSTRQHQGAGALRNGVEGDITTPFGPESFAGVSVLH